MCGKEADAFAVLTKMQKVNFNKTPTDTKELLSGVSNGILFVTSYLKPKQSP